MLVRRVYSVVISYFIFPSIMSENCLYFRLISTIKCLHLLKKSKNFIFLCRIEESVLYKLQ